MKRTLLSAALAAVAFAALPSAPAAAHPLGNFSVNRYAGLTLHPDRIDAVAVADLAELPTLQDPPATCDEAAQALVVEVSGTQVPWTITDSSLTFTKGAGGLQTSRLTCHLTARTTLDTPTRIEVTNRFRDDRIGWRELSASGSGIALTGSPLPTTSPSNELRDYPRDLLTSPSDVRTASFTAAPGTSSATIPTAAPASTGTPSFLASAERHLEDLIGNRITPLVGFLAVLLSLLLGAAHAALPGHGKTVMAAYLAGSRGRPRDAILVGATVTFTHTAGVLALGLLLTTASGIAGETVLSYLGLASGILVTLVGLATLIPAIRRHTAHHHTHAHPHTQPSKHNHPHDPPHSAAVPHSHSAAAPHSHSAAPAHNVDRDAEPTQAVAHTHDVALVNGRALTAHHNHDHDIAHTTEPHAHSHDTAPTHDFALTHHHTLVHNDAPAHGDAHAHAHGDSQPHAHGDAHAHDHAHGDVNAHAHGDRHVHAHGDVHGVARHYVLEHGHSHSPKAAAAHDHRPSRWSIAGLGVAGGLVPSPSALIVLLGAAALGRTIFGVLLVLAYGIGMAATLTAAGLLLLRLRDRLERHSSLFTRWRAIAQPLTAALIVLVGLGLAGRAFFTLS
ncbi:sulfite exporter TauE/SafE family protein [Paractinoplanes atraurantiacus]|uniref:High-affinity nickel-transport protein n=1 Tax=Paractinoplanes atraurantiacus TaxID=1036182 RepID=A0A285HNW3_9ACTN|nr:sulfite exporter TauE/SafE family protein [Actinoplanes atraurantiacus]SNY37415.1 High-affinity nickel-transport protein [Actinoplanes atraurantiacus]